MKCDACGIESDFKAGFINERKSFSKSRRTLCANCWRRRHHTFEGWNQVSILAAGIVGYVLFWLDPSSVVGRFLTTFFLLNIFLILSIVPHELGHAIAARLVGWRVFAVVIGLGKQVFKFRVAEIIYSFHWLPVAGVTRVAPTDARWFRVKRFIVFSAGLVVNAAIAGIILLIWSEAWHDFGFWGLPRLARLCLWANLYILVFNLWPRQSKALGMATDGKQLLKTFSKKKEDIDKLLAARFVLEAMVRRDEYKDSAGALDWCRKGLAAFPSNVHLLNMTGVLCLDGGDYRGARQIFCQLLSGEVDQKGIRFVILNNIAYTDALLGDTELLSEADEYSKEAYAGAPWVPFIVGTRGTVLVAMGQLEPGIKMLKEALEKVPLPRNKAENACHLAMAHFRLGKPEEAGKYLKLAKQLDAECRLIKRTEAEQQKNEAVT